MANLLIKTPEIIVSFDGSGGGGTSYVMSGGLTALGNFFGEEWVQIIITGGGCLRSLAWGLIAPAPLCIYSGMARLLTEACYALGAYRITGWNPGHDYQFLRVFAHVPPLA